MVPGFLYCPVMLNEQQMIGGLLTPVRLRASPTRGKPLYAKKAVETNRYILYVVRASDVVGTKEKLT